MALEWLILTLLSAVAYSALDLIEKHLVSHRIPSALMLAIFVALFYPINLMLIPSFVAINLSFMPSLVSFAIGAAMGVAYLLFMKSIRIEDLSRVVTLHYTYPLFVLPIAYLVLNEGLTTANYAGIVLLVASTFVISYKKIGKHIPYSPALFLMTALNVAIAIENVVAKYLFEFTNFWSFIFWVTAGIVVIRMLLLLLMPRMRKEFLGIHFDWKIIVYGLSVSLLFLVANLLYYGAVSIQSVSLVSGLSAIQPMFILAMAVALSYLNPKFIYEELTRTALMSKSIAVALVLAGTYLVTVS